MDVHEIENQRKMSEFHCFISIFSINLAFFFVDLDVFRYCGIEVNWDKEKRSRFFCQCERPVYGQCAARGGDIFVHLTGIVCPWAGREFDGKFLKNVKSPPHALPPPPLALH